MKTLLIYLDNCCYNRPFDKQTTLTVQFETLAKLQIQELIRRKKIALVWSFMLDYENNDNPFDEKREKIAEWKKFAVIDCDYSEEIEAKSYKLKKSGLKPKDAVHIACAVLSGADYFLTTDKKILNKRITEISIINPLDFIRKIENA